MVSCYTLWIGLVHILIPYTFKPEFCTVVHCLCNSFNSFFLQKYDRGEPDAGWVKLRSEHKGDVERHGCSEFGRQCQHCIDAGACHQIIVKGRCLKSHGQWFYAWFKESCYDAEDAREKLAADKKGFPEQTEVRQDKTRLCMHVL